MYSFHVTSHVTLNCLHNSDECAYCKKSEAHEVSGTDVLSAMMSRKLKDEKERFSYDSNDIEAEQFSDKSGC